MKWLFLVHQVQSRNSRERVKVWRLIRKVGAVLHRNSVYVLPYDRERLEDFQWVCQQIRDSSGEASVFVSESKDPGEDRILRELFLQNRKEEYAEIDQSARLLLGRMRRRSAGKEERVPVEWEKEARQLKERLEEAKRKDFFSKTPPAETSRCFREIENELITLRTGIPRSIEVPSRQRRDFRNRAWATREKIHVDRLGSAWLIKRFIDPDAKFVFAPESELPADAVHFDVLGAEFSHHADNCTFETILKSFRIKDKALQQIAEIIHDIDLKDHKFARPEASGFDAMIRALSQSSESDENLLEQGTVFLDALYQYYSGKKLSVKDRQPQRRSGRKRRKNS